MRIAVRCASLLTVFLLLFAAPLLAADDATCLECHADAVPASYAASVHAGNGCVSCHAEITDVELHMMGEQMPGAVNCARCHSEPVEQMATSVHAAQGLDCTACHGAVHEISKGAENKQQVVETCSQCHDTSDYQASIHGQGVAKGNPDSPACNNCHGVHNIQPLGEASSVARRAKHTEACVVCHADEAMMERNQVLPMAVGSYLNSYHGKIYRLGQPDIVAGCADCHTAHKALPKDDPASSVNPANKAATCQACHTNAGPGFASFIAHADHSDRQNYPILFWTFTFMSTLLISVFAVFWLHSLLWALRGFIHNRQVKKEMALHGHAVAKDAHTIYRRFRPIHVFLHILVIVSFLGLSLTGLPLKFSDQGWALWLMAQFGGPAAAGKIHRICAGITFGYFFIACIMSVKFLFLRKDIPGSWLQRLFGPDSLCPNWRDLSDIRAMVRWFTFTGPKPTFERWTYWEKFDFFAVFWGMFAIGGSGLLLLFPEFFSRVVPGWAFNVATIIHSDEALLATGFIFTVHFFNTHFRPEKFPMDFVVFNGEITKEEMLDERRDQWERYARDGRTEEFRVQKPSGAVFDLAFKLFGFVAQFIGLALVAMMVYAFLAGGYHI